MLRKQRSIRRGLTLIETLVSIAIVGILVALLLPAIQAARESARKAHCQNNLKQTALALQAFHDANNNLPSPYNGTSLSYPLKPRDLFHLHSWRAVLLPYLEQSALHDSIDWHALATDRVNEWVAATVVSPYICPSGASPTANMGRALRYEWQSLDDTYSAVSSDYDELAGMWVFFEVPPAGNLGGNPKYLRWSVWGSATFAGNQFTDMDIQVPARFDIGTIYGDLASYRAGKFREVTDGLSNSIMLVERGGRPLHMVDGRPEVDNPNVRNLGWVGWSASNSFSGRIHHPDLGINQDNSRGIYSDHAGGAYVALADGSVTFLTESTDVATLAEMIGRADGEP
jgi:prepilin-type N-terminal cleavage/methylation domain-containing protein